MLTVISAVTWAIYEVAYTYVSDVKNEKMPLTSSKFDSIMETMTTLGMIGLANAIAVLPFLLILHMSGQENVRHGNYRALQYFSVANHPPLAPLLFSSNSPQTPSKPPQSLPTHAFPSSSTSPLRLQFTSRIP